VSIVTLETAAPGAVFDFLETTVSRRGPEHWRWKYQLDRGLPGRAFYHAASDGTVGGFVGLLPTTLHAGTTTARAAWFVDWATRPGDGSVGIGVGLLRRAEAATDVLLTLQGSADTRAILPKLRWQSTDTPATWVRRLSAKSLVERGPLRASALRVPARVAGRIVERFSRVTRPESGDLALEEVERFAPSYDAVWERRRVEFAPLMERSSAQLNFMCADYPGGGYRCLLVRDRDEIAGHVVLRVDENGGSRRGRIIDALWERARAGAAEWLVHSATWLLQECGVDYIECTASTDDLQQALRACRFRRRHAVPVWYHRLPAGVPTPDTWFITYLDCDRAYR